MESLPTSGAHHSDIGVSLKGTPVVPGVACAPAVWMQPRPELPGPGDHVPEEDRRREFDRFLDAVEIVAARLATRADAASGSAAELLHTSAALVADPAWAKTVRQRISQGHPADYSVVQATDKFTAMFRAAGGVTAERTADLTDLRDRVLAQLLGYPEPGLPELAEPAILLAGELAPADAADLNPTLVLALVTARGGSTGHTAVIARQLDLPCVVGVGDSLTAIREGELLLADGGEGTVATGVTRRDGQTAVAASRQRARERTAWRGPGATSDGHRVRLMASVPGVAAARTAAGSAAEGIGLYRSELSFLRDRTEPTVDEQAAVYAELLQTFPGGRVMLRTFDPGSDKPLAFTDPGRADNPALGVRGIRIARASGGLVLRQLDAIAQAVQELRRRGSPTDAWVMAPMVSTASEAEWFSARCVERGLVPGAMVEVPAAALMADRILPHLRFVSVGTNDLTQYTMAADRTSAELVDFVDPWQPAVLRLVDHVCRVGRETETAVGICGESAADPLLACVLVGLGAGSLSMAAASIPQVGSALEKATLLECRQAAAAALESAGPDGARSAARVILPG